MNRKRIAWWAAAVALAVCAAVYAQTTRGRGGRGGWSYAVADMILVGDRLDIKLSTPDQIIEAQDWPTFYQKIGASPTPVGRAPEAIMLNGMGSDGWELVLVYKPDLPQRATRYVFKRPGP